jgi:outer membrane protein TolC
LVNQGVIVPINTIGGLNATLPEIEIEDTEPQPLDIADDFGSTFDDYFTERGSQQFVARAVFSIPFPNTVASKRVTTTELELRKSKTDVRRLEQGIIVSVRAAARGVKSALQGIEAADRSRAAAAEQLRAERVRLEHGESTPFQVLETEEDLTEAESQRIAALQAYRNAITALERFQGTILESSNVAIDSVRERPLRLY